VDINADWKETIVVYGVLDPTDTVQFIRIEKAFLDEKNSALITAKITDSLYMDSVLAVLKPDNGPEIILYRTLEVTKDSGIFGNDYNPLWKTSEHIDVDRNYTLEITNLRTGNKIRSNTRTVSPASISAPVKNANGTFTLFAEYITFEFTPKSNSYAYDVKLELVYDEFLKTDTSNKITKIANWNVITGVPVTPFTLSRNQVPKLAFLQFMAASIKGDSNVYRRVKYVNITFFGGNQILADFISVNQPSIGIVQKTAEYTNIEGGYGIFASRCVQPIRKIKMDLSSVNYIINHPETKHLNFIQ